MNPYREEQKIVVERRMPVSMMLVTAACALSTSLLGYESIVDGRRIEALERAIPMTHVVGVPGQSWTEYVNADGQLVFMGPNGHEVMTLRDHQEPAPPSALWLGSSAATPSTTNATEWSYPKPGDVHISICGNTVATFR